MDKGITIVPIHRRASWARHFVVGVDDAPIAARAETPKPDPLMASYTIVVVIDRPFASSVQIARDIRDRLAGLNPRGVEVK